MAPLRAVKTDEEISHIPLDQPILVELPGGMGDDEIPEIKPGKTAKEPTDPGAKQLQDQLEAAQAAQRASDARAEKAERETAQARREAAEATTRSQSLEGDIITGGLASAQAELAAAEQELERAGEAGDYKAQAKANARIGRASAQIVNLESGAAEIAERKPPVKEPVQEQPRQQFDPVAAIDANPNLFPAEKAWMKSHPDCVTDNSRNTELGVAYQRAIKAGHVRGTTEYFDYLNDFMGYAKSDNQGSTSVQAPPSRNDRDATGRPSAGKVTLSPEQREIARSMGVSEIEYAKNVAKFQAAQAADPERYSNR